MKKFLNISLFSSLLLVLISCEKEVDDISLPKAEPKLVVFSYISPSDSLIKVEVTKSIPFFGRTNNLDENEPVINASVQIVSGGISVQLPYDDLNRRYSVPNDNAFPIVAGQLYSLSVTTPGGLSCTGRTRVPLTATPIKEILLDSTIRDSDGFQEKRYRIITKWNDVAGIDNFYHYNLKLDNTSGGGFGISNCNDVLSDEGNEGNEISRTCSYSSFFDPSFPESSSFEGNIFLLTTDVEYYKYHETYYRYNDENPFAEPVRIHTNIEGGLGCFGSYLETKISVRP